MPEIRLFSKFFIKKGIFCTFLLAAWQLGLATELLHEELHHPLGTHHIVFGLHVDVSEKSFQDHSEASICTLCAKLHHPNPNNKKVMIYSQICIKSNPPFQIMTVLQCSMWVSECYLIYLAFRKACKKDLMFEVAEMNVKNVIAMEKMTRKR